MNHHDHYKLALYHWNQLIQEACDFANIELPAECQSYLLLTLIRYMQNEALAEQAFEMSWQHESQSVARKPFQLLKTRADHCLILAGLFPARLERQEIRIGHYIKMGRECFSRLATQVAADDSALYNKLSDLFVDMVDILVTIRAFNGSPAMPLIQALELWSDTGSKTAYQALTLNRRSIPLNEVFISQAYKH